MACGLCVEAVACDLCAGVAAHGRVACAATLVALCAVSRLAGSRRASTDGSNYCVHPTTWNCRQCTNAAIEKSASASASATSANASSSGIAPNNLELHQCTNAAIEKPSYTTPAAFESNTIFFWLRHNNTGNTRHGL